MATSPSIQQSLRGFDKAKDLQLDRATQNKRKAHNLTTLWHDGKPSEEDLKDIKEALDLDGYPTGIKFPAELFREFVFEYPAPKGYGPKFFGDNVALLKGLAGPCPDCGVTEDEPFCSDTDITAQLYNLLVKTANQLDAMGEFEEASEIDSLLGK